MAITNSIGLTVLENSITPLVGYFNENQGKLRFVTLLSPT